MKRTLSILSVSTLLALSALAQVPAANQQPAEKLSKQQLETLIATAKTPAEHERIAQYYEAKAQEDVAQSQEHAEMAAQFRQNAVTGSAKWTTGTVSHCDYLAKSLKLDATKMQRLAQKHEEMAQHAGQM